MRTHVVRRLLPAAVIMGSIVMFAAVAFADDIGKPGDNNGPPVGITPVTVKLQTVLDANDEAVGRRQHKSITEIESGYVTGYGLVGPFRDVRAGLHSGDDFRSTDTLGPFTTEYGRYNGQRWRQNENGITDVMQDTVRADENDARSFVENTENPKNDVKLLGEVTSPVDAYVVQVSSKLFDPFWSFYDEKTGLLDRIEIGGSDDRQVITYDDYHLADGIREAWHTHSGDSNAQNAFDRHVTSDQYGVAVTDQDLAIPPTRSGFIQFPAGKSEVDLPSDIVAEDIGFFGLSFADPLIRVTVNGRGLDMLLDSSENGMVLDNEITKELGLTTYGPYNLDDKGNYYPSRAIIASLNIGDLQMKNVYVDCDQVAGYEPTGAKPVGIIGYDFLANAVVSIDYVHKTVQAFDPVQFVPPADSVAVPTNIDDGIPFVSAQIGQSTGDLFLLDTASPTTVIFPAFWQAHPDDVKDEGAGRILNAVIFQDAIAKATQLKTLVFGGVVFKDFSAIEFMDVSAVEGLDDDGDIGYDFLRYFNVYFDYPQHEIFLEPNDNFKRAQGSH